jgi:hypothetical protein
VKESKRHNEMKLREINNKRSALVEEAQKHGINSKQALKKSEELDQLIINYMKNIRKY